MSSIWGYIVGQTSQSPAKLITFGALTLVATGVIGSIFSSMTAAAPSEIQRKKDLAQLPYDSQRTANAQQQRLSSMIKDMVDGQGDQHWKAAMRGTLVPHPNAENKTMGMENEARQGSISFK